MKWKTVGELIEKLREQDPNALVALAGFEFDHAWGGDITVTPSGTVRLEYSFDLNDANTGPI
jgi:hypothetical protein